MELNGINSSTYTSADYTSGRNTASTVSEGIQKDDTAVVYEKNESVKKHSAYGSTGSKVDQSTIDKLKADAEARYSQLASLVEKLISKQGQSYKYSTLGDLMKDVAAGKLDVDPETVAQAKKDVADDGYWGVEQTATRIVDFAKALTGGDPDKIDEMRAAIEKGFAGAKKVWGGDLPEISGKTYDRINELLNEWQSEVDKQ